MEYLNETLQICFTSKVTYCDKEPSLLPFQFMSYLPLIDLKNGFWPVVHLLYGISEWNFTDMLTIKGYILWVRIVTLTFPDCELSTLDWSENCFLTCSSFHPSVLMTIKGYILWVRIVTLTFPNCELIRPFLMELLPFLPLKNGFWPVFLFCLWYLNETSQICWTAKVTYYNEGPSLLPFQFMSYLPLINLVYLSSVAI